MLKQKQSESVIVRDRETERRESEIETESERKRERLRGLIHFPMVRYSKGNAKTNSYISWFTPTTVCS